MARPPGPFDPPDHPGQGPLGPQLPGGGKPPGGGKLPDRDAGGEPAPSVRTEPRDFRSPMEIQREARWRQMDEVRRRGDIEGEQRLIEQLRGRGYHPRQISNEFDRAETFVRQQELLQKARGEPGQNPESQTEKERKADQGKDQKQAGREMTEARVRTEARAAGREITDRKQGEAGPKPGSNGGGPVQTGPRQSR